MKKIITLLLILSVSATISISCAQEGWHTIQTITSRGNQTTDYFEIPTDEWRTVWSHSEWPSYYLGWFSVYVYSEDEFYSQMGIIYSEGEELNGILNIHEGRKKFYMVIDTLRVESYTLKVEFYEGSLSPTFSPDQTPSSTPYQEPQQINQELIIGVTIAVAVIGAGLGLLVYLLSKENN